MKAHILTRAALLTVSLALDGAVAHAQQRPATGPLRFQETVTVPGATRDQIYNTALPWFSQTFTGPKESVAQNSLAAVLTGAGAQRYLPPFMGTSCSGWLRYRVLLVAKDGRCLLTIDGFSHEGDPLCNKRSFGLLTRDWLSTRVTRTIFDMTLQPSRHEADDMETWVDMKERATTLAETLARSLRAKLATATVGKPAP